jgi:hypothetical protein
VTLDGSLAVATSNASSGVLINDRGIVLASAGALDVYYKGAMNVKAGTANSSASGGSVAFASANARMAAETINIVGTGGVSNSFNLIGGKATAANTSNSIAISAAGVTLFGRTSVKIDIGGSLLLKAGTSSESGTATAAALIDPAVPMTITTGGNLVVQAGVGPGSAAQILNQGDIVLTVGGAGPAYSYAYTSGGSVTASGLVIIGGAGSGLLGANKKEIALGDEIKLNGGPYNLLLDYGLAKATIEANSPRSAFVNGDLLNYLVFATNEITALARLRIGRSITDDSDLPSCN